MPASYRKWFSIHCLHDYFSDGQCNALGLHPTPECRQLLARYGCLFRPLQDGGAVYYADSDSGDRLLSDQESRPLAFTLSSTDPLLDTYTDMDPSAAQASPAQSCYYFNNVDRNVDSGAGVERLLLHPPGAALNNGPIVVKPHCFAHSFNAPLRDATLSVVDSVRHQTVWETTTPKEPASSWNLNLSGVPCGRYGLNINGNSSFEFYLFDQPPVSYWGLVEIYPGGPGMSNLVAEACRLSDARGVPLARDFSIALSARKSIWRYHIINDSPDHNSFDNFTVIGSRKNARHGTDISFTKVRPHPEEEENEMVFESKEIIPLRQAPCREHVFSFKPAGKSTNSGLRLPYALARNTRLDAGSGSRQMYSDIFVYL